MTDRHSRIRMGLRQIGALAWYILKTSWISLGVGGLVVVLLAWSGEHAWINRWEPVLALATLVSVWLIEKRRQWIDSLPKTLTAYFWRWNGDAWENDAVWEEAFLTGESDIRATAQQLGTQLLGEGQERLLLEGHYHVENENPQPDVQNGIRARRYTIHVPYRGIGRKEAGEYRLYQKSKSRSGRMMPNVGAIQAFNRQVEG